MFKRENLESNPYLIFKMNANLEIPVTAIYKDKKISAICTNLAIIREVIIYTINSAIKGIRLCQTQQASRITEIKRSLYPKSNLLRTKLP